MPNLLLEQPIFLLLSTILSFLLGLSASSEFFDGEF
jgi:hypothetical protein